MIIRVIPIDIYVVSSYIYIGFQILIFTEHFEGRTFLCQSLLLSTVRTYTFVL